MDQKYNKREYKPSQVQNIRFFKITILTLFSSLYMLCDLIVSTTKWCIQKDTSTNQGGKFDVGRPSLHKEENKTKHLKGWIKNV